jgi:hypothetical protein
MIEVIGVEKTTRDLAGISERITDLAPAFEQAARMFEASEARLFGELGGKYVRTGALRRSLTVAGEGIRDVHQGSLRFGSDVPYAAFQVEDPGPVTPAGGLKRKGHPSAVLKLTDEQAHAVAQDAMGHIRGGEL